MKKILIILFSVIIIIATIIAGIYRYCVFNRNARIENAIERGKLSVHFSEQSKSEPIYLFDEDKNITQKTYLITEKEINIPVLLYHEFYDEEPPKDLWGIISTPSKFEEDMINIIGQGYTFVSLDRVIDYKNGVKGLPEKCVVLTFDDGYKSNYTEIFPILKKYNIPATIFIIEDLVGSETHFTWEEAKELKDSGLVSIYSHAHSHVDMTKLDIEEFREKTEANLNNMKEKLGEQKYIVYSYPLGFYNDETNKVLKELGVELIMTTNLGLNNKTNLESGLINREYVAYNFNNLKLMRILNGK